VNKIFGIMNIESRYKAMGSERDRKGWLTTSTGIRCCETLDVYSSNNPLPLGLKRASDSSPLDVVHALITLELLNDWLTVPRVRPISVHDIGC